MFASAEVAIQAALQQFQSGQWAEGERICREVLVTQPQNADALHLLGIAMGNAGKANEAIELIGKAIHSNPRVPDFYSNLSKYLCDQSRPGEAIAAARQAVQLQPKFAIGWINLACAFSQNKNLIEAAQSYAEAVRLQPNVAEFQRMAAQAFLNIRQAALAVPHFRRCVELAGPDQRTSPLFDLGVALVADSKFNEAIAAYQQSVQLDPKREWTWNNLGTALRQVGRLDEAAQALHEALRLKPDWGEAYCNLTAVLIAQGQIESANQTIQLALQKAPQHPVVHYNHGVLLLLQGDFERGWAEYEWRWKCEEAYMPTKFATPPWRGEPLEGKTILLHAEQGLGDTIQFSRYVPLIAQRGAKVSLCVHPELVSLLKNLSGVDAIASHPKDLPPFDAHSYLMDLPLGFQTRPESIPNKTPYLTPDAQLLEKWAQKIPAGADLKVGISWAGRATHANDARRSTKLSLYAPLATILGITFFNLQKGAGSEQASAPPPGMKWIDPTNEIRDFADTAALVSHLDLVITVDSALAHLIGAIGKPVWILTPFAPDWRWMLNREDNPWYPTGRLFRQPALGDWTTVIERIRQELTALVRKPKI